MQGDSRCLQSWSNRADRFPLRCANVYCTADVRHQGLSVALALSQRILQGSEGAWRMQGGGFAGTIQAYVPGRLLKRYHTAIEQVFGQGSCYVLRLREQGAVRVI